MRIAIIFLLFVIITKALEKEIEFISDEKLEMIVDREPLSLIF